MKIRILFGTETGESELVAEEISDELSERFSVEIEDMSDVDIATLGADDFFLVVCSTTGQGDLPATAIPFHDQLSDERPDLTGMRYGILGRGDSNYKDTYSQGSEHIDRILTELGAQRVGEYGREDAADIHADDEVVLEWANGVIEAAGIEVGV